MQRVLAENSSVCSRQVLERNFSPSLIIKYTVELKLDGRSAKLYG